MSSSSSSLRFACSFASCSSRILSLRSVALFVLTFELISLRATLRFVAFDRFDAPDRCDAIEPTTDTASPSFSAAAWAVLSFSAAARAVLVGGAPLADAPPSSLKLSRSTLFSLSTRSRQQSEYCCAVILNGCGARDRQGMSGAGARWASARPVCASRGSPWWMLRVVARVDTNRSRRPERPKMRYTRAASARQVSACTCSFRAAFGLLAPRARSPGGLEG